MPSKSKARIQHEADIKTISEAIAEAVVEYGLCGEGVNAFFEKVNAKLNVPLTSPRRKGDVYVTFTIKVFDVALERDDFGDWDLPAGTLDHLSAAVHDAGSTWVDGLGEGVMAYAALDDVDVTL